MSCASSVILKILSSQRKTKAAGSHLYVASKKVELAEAESRMVVARGRGLGELGSCWSKGITSISKRNRFWGI